MAKVERGCLALGDITGYTKYLAGVELDHSQDVLADLMGVVVEQMRGLLHLAKLEGDAVFCYEHEGEADGSMLLSMVESCYFAFVHRLQTIRRYTTCACNACRLIPGLNLKFMTHYGEYFIHEIAGSQELVGRDVILAHRLLKNTVAEKTGLRGYALFTQAALDRFSLDPLALGMAKHADTYEDVGDVVGYVLNLEARWQEEQERRVVYIAPGEGETLFEHELPAPPPIVWDFLTSPTKRPLWQVDTLRVDQANPRGVREIGTTNHCVHGDFAVDEEILDWKPFRYFTERANVPFGSFLMTTELTPVEHSNHTSVSWRMLPEGGPEGLQVAQQALPMLQGFFHTSMEGLTRLLDSVGAAAAERSETLST